MQTIDPQKCAHVDCTSRHTKQSPYCLDCEYAVIQARHKMLMSHTLAWPTKVPEAEREVKAS